MFASIANMYGHTWMYARFLGSCVGGTDHGCSGIVFELLISCCFDDDLCHHDLLVDLVEC